MAPATGGAAATAPPPPRRRPGGCGDCAGSRGVLRSPAGSRGRRDAAQGRARCLGGRATGAGARAVRGARRGRRVELRPAAPNEEHIFVCKAGDRREGERLWAAPRGPRRADPAAPRRAAARANHHSQPRRLPESCSSIPSSRAFCASSASNRSSRARRSASFSAFTRSSVLFAFAVLRPCSKTTCHHVGGAGNALAAAARRRAGGVPPGTAARDLQLRPPRRI